MVGHARDRYVDSDDNNDVTSAVRPRRIEVLSGSERRRKWSDETKMPAPADSEQLFQSIPSSRYD